ncbi:MAG: class I SAM-dependent methyltransferase [Chloroflexi bacterium]|nr:class I SAM-dependent methyltransferase [Chloroflexota bacterium]
MQTIDEAQLMAFIGKVVGDFGSATGIALAAIGDRLGLYKTLAASGPMNSQELADTTGYSERYLREWLLNQAAGGYIEYDAAAGRYWMTPEQALALANDDSPASVSGGFHVMMSAVQSMSRIAELFKTGGGMTWGEHTAELFGGTERFFRSGYVGNLLSSWIPALDGVQEKLERGATVADVGCGHAAATILMAQAFPNTHFVGVDTHEPSIQHARHAARDAGTTNTLFEVAEAQYLPRPNNEAGRYDLIAYFDSLHDMADPVGAASSAYDTLAEDGTILLVEPMAGNRPEENLNPVGRVYSGASVLLCTPNALAGGGSALGTLASEDALASVFRSVGFTQFRRAAETPFNRVFEIRR